MKNHSERTGAQETVRILLDSESVLFSPRDPFTLTSGEKSPVYVDCRRLISFPKERRFLMSLAWTLIEKQIGWSQIDAVAGGETAGIPFAAFLAERTDLPMLYLRKKPKGFGRASSHIEGVFKAGQTILLVEDLMTDGGSKYGFVESLRSAGLKCHHCFVIFRYGIFPETESRLQEKQIVVHALAEWSDMMQELKKRNRFSAGEIESLQAFFDDPQNWRRQWPDTGGA